MIYIFIYRNFSLFCKSFYPETENLLKNPNPLITTFCETKKKNLGNIRIIYWGWKNIKFGNNGCIKLKVCEALILIIPF